MAGDRYNEHRFDNYGAWLEREDRLKAQSQGRPLGHGYAEPKPPPPPPEERPFYVLEESFTSGLLINRKYDQLQHKFPTEITRADPWHFPNVQELQEKDHFRDWRRRTQHTDPTRWQVDPELRAAVPEKMVKHHIAKERREIRANIDPQKMEPMFSSTVRPEPKTLHELNVDLSCVDGPAREIGNAAVGRLKSAASQHSSASKFAAAKGRSDMMDSRFGWCLGGRKPLNTQPNPMEMEMIKSRSLPEMRLNGTSTLSGNQGGESSAFYGEPSRRFGENTFDGRMRGGKHARDGFAGTFPNLEGLR